jgi:hypothetical protein
MEISVETSRRMTVGAAGRVAVTLPVWNGISTDTGDALSAGVSPQADN